MRKSTFLVSFCNNGKNTAEDNGHYVIKVHIDTQDQVVAVEPVDLNLPAGFGGNGITGMCHAGDHVVLLLQRTPSVLLYLHQDLSYSHHFELTGLKGIHSILNWNQAIYLSVTNQDRIVKFDHDQVQHEVWTNHTMEDQMHLNSISLHQGRLMASAFGPKSNQLWSSATAGYVFDVASGDKVIEDIWHPHSSFSYAGKVYCCDSSNQRIISESGVYKEGLPGYSRGLYVDDGLILCGNSQGRLVSHSTGVKISNKSDQGLLGGLCGLNVCFKQNNSDQFIDFSEMATEIFDILPL